MKKLYLLFLLFHFMTIAIFAKPIFNESDSLKIDSFIYGPEISPTDNILYVNVNSSAGSYASGSSWNNALTSLADALIWANSNKENWTVENPLKIYIAKGTYFPKYKSDFSFTSNYDRDNTFSMIENVELYGGFDPVNGISTLTDVRILPTKDNAVVDGTILNGDFKGDDVVTGSGSTLAITNNGENAYHIISAGNVSSVLLNGLTIKGGNANGNEAIMINNILVSQRTGGGIAHVSNYSYVINSLSITKAQLNLSNVLITNNSSSGDGGGIYSNLNVKSTSENSEVSSIVNLVNSFIINNISSSNGGGVYSYSQASNDNDSDMIFKVHSFVTLVNSSVSHNSSFKKGGGIYSSSDDHNVCHENSITESAVRLVNSSVSDNSSSEDGGGIYVSSLSINSSSITSVINSNLIGNKGSNIIYLDGTNKTLTVNNSIVYGNKDNSNIIFTSNESLFNAYNTIQFSSKNSLIQGNTDLSNGNLLGTTNPLFIDEENGDYHLSKFSPLINKGDNSLYMGEFGGTMLNLNTDKDLYGNSRLFSLTTDIGAFESQSVISQDANNILYVKKGGSGIKDGSSWANALDELSDALIWANSNKDSFTANKPLKIYIAKGTYYPMYSPVDGDNFTSTPINNRYKSFLMVDNVNLYGGFDPVNNYDFDKRIYGDNGTVLSGDLANNDLNNIAVNNLVTDASRQDNAYHVLTFAQSTQSISIIDGFVIKGGNANLINSSYKVNGLDMWANYGGGIILSLQGAGDVSDKFNNIHLINSTLTENSASQDGGGITYVSYDNSFILNLMNTTISNNYGTNTGGAIYTCSLHSTINILNSVLKNNEANIGSAIYTNGYENKSIINLLNSTIVGNKGDNTIYYEDGINTIFNSKNSIIYNNKNALNDNFIDNSWLAGIVPIELDFTYKNSLLQGYTLLENNNISDENLSLPLLFNDAENGDYRLSKFSPLINKGDNSLYTSFNDVILDLSTAKDLAGNQRLFEEIVDIGAYEYYQLEQSINWKQELLIGCTNVPQIQLLATSTSNLPVTYTSSNENIATIEGDKLTLLKIGYVEITAAQLGNETYLPAKNVTKLLNSLLRGKITQKWNDVLVFDNSDNQYTVYQWYKNNQLIQGATGQFYKSTDALNGNYYVVTTDINGQELQTCTIEINEGVKNGGIKLLPNPVRRTESFEVIANYTEEELEGAELKILNLNSVLIDKTNNVRLQTTLKAPSEVGIYLIYLVLKDGRTASIKLLVK